MKIAARSPVLKALRSTALLASALPLLAFAAPPKRSLAHKPATRPAIHPAASIPVQPLGFEPPSMFYLALRQSSLSLNFIDPTHLLFTFRVNALIQRKVSNDQPADQDQVIRADVLDISTGKVLRQTQWIMHDHQRYLWSLGHGNFLVRIGNTLYQTGGSLILHPFLKPRHSLILIEVSPGHRYLSVETEIPADPASLVPRINLDGELLAQPEHVDLTVYQTAGLTPLFRMRSRHALDLPVLRNGFLDLLSLQPPKGNDRLWIIRKVEFQPVADRAHLPAHLPAVDILTLHSDCRPSLLPLGGNIVLTGCAGDGADHLMTAVNLNGQRLWQQWWQARYIWHTTSYASNGSRFALASLMTDQPLAALGPSNINDVERQLVGVFDTGTGKLVLVRDATPIISAGQNFALSANGGRFAILRNQAIDVYNLPPSRPTAPPTKKAAR